jgi:cytochrome c553
LAFAKNGNAAMALIMTRIQYANAGESGDSAAGRNQLSQTDRIMKRILMLSIAIMAVSALSAGAADAKTTYHKECAKCHGADGKGQTFMGKRLKAKDYTDPKVQKELTDEAAFKAIKEGLKDKEGKQLMRPAEGLSDAEIKDLVAYMRKFKK